MDPYLRRLAAIPPLEAATEHELAIRVRAGDSAAREALITGSLRLVVLRARLFGLHGSRLLDAVQAGTLGLIEAIDRFDPDRGRLSTYAWWWIGRSMREAFLTADCELTTDPADPSTAQFDPPDDLLTELDPDLALVLETRFGSGFERGAVMPRTEVARQLGLTVSQVRTKEAKALSHLRRRLAKVGHRAPREQPGADPP